MSFEDREESIRDRAYRIWIEEGRPEGRAAEHWLAAEQALDEEEGATTPLTDPAPFLPPNH